MSKPRKISELQLEINPSISDLIALASGDVSKRTTLGSVLNSSIPTTFGTTTINGDLNVNGNLNVSTIVSASVLYDSGSTIFGNSLDNTHDFIGDVSITGSLTITGETQHTGSVDITGDYTINGNSFSSSLFQSSSISGSVIQFTKGDNTTQQVKIPDGLGYSGLGWARYDDTTYTTSSAFTITDGADVKIPCNGSGSIETHMHSSIPFFNPSTQRIQAENEGDTYTITIDFSMKAATNPQDGDDVRLAMNNTVGTPYTRVGRDLHFAKKDTNWHKFHEIFQYYSDTDFVTNGNEFNIIPNGVDVQIADVIIFIQRTQNHSQH